VGVFFTNSEVRPVVDGEQGYQAEGNHVSERYQVSPTRYRTRVVVLVLLLLYVVRMVTGITLPNTGT